MKSSKSTVCFTLPANLCLAALLSSSQQVPMASASMLDSTDSKHAILFLLLQNMKRGKNLGVTDLQNWIFKTTDSKDELYGCFLKDLINHYDYFPKSDYS